MKVSEAWKILDLPQSSSKEEVKKKFKQLAAQKHPDINKETGAEEEFKKLNEAYQVVSSGKSSDIEDRNRQYQQSPFDSFADFFNNQQTFHAQPISLDTTISFAESVTGTKVNLTFKRNVKCHDCNGEGQKTLDNGCKECQGKGQATVRKGNMIFIQTCTKCMGKTKHEDCSVCRGNGYQETNASVQVAIPGGVITGNMLNLRGMGNYLGSTGLFEQYTDAHLTITVTPSHGLSILDKDVISNITISLKEALSGCTKTVPTITGNQDINIPALSRHKEEVIIPNLGVNKIGNQRVILDVIYPNDVSLLVNLLEETPQISA